MLGRERGTRTGEGRWSIGAAVLCLLAASSVPPSLVAQETDSGLDAALAWADSVVSAAVTAETLPGVVLLVGREGKVIHQRAYGAAKLVDHGTGRLERPEAMTVEHRFDLASVTKVMATTYAMMLLVDRGRVALDRPVHAYLPDFRGPDKDAITVRHLLTHRAGLYRWKPTYYHATDPAGAYAYIRDLPLEFPVGEGRHYSDLGFMLAGYLVERVTGRRLDEFLQAELYGPLGLTRTGFLREGESAEGPVAATSHGNPYESRMVADDNFGYLCDEDPDDFTNWRAYTLQGEVNDGNAWYAHQGVAGHAGLFSTSGELNVLLQLLLSGGRHEGRRVLGAAVVSAFLTPDTLTGNGVGWAMSVESVGEGREPVEVFSHSGFTGTYVAGVPELDLSFVFLSNRQNLGVDSGTQYPNAAAVYTPIMQRLVRALAPPAR